MSINGQAKNSRRAIIYTRMAVEWKDGHKKKNQWEKQTGRQEQQKIQKMEDVKMLMEVLNT